MTDSSPNPYDVLAPLYDDAGFSNFGGVMASKLLTFLQRSGWLGRRVLDIGCGTGLSSSYFATEASMNAYGLDSSAPMLEIAERRLTDSSFHVDYLHQDMRAGNYPEDLDLIFSIGNVFNEVKSMRELELVFSHCHKALSPGKILLFDMTSIKGILTQFAGNQFVLDISERLFVTVQNYLNYESISVQQQLVCFQRNIDGWDRTDAILSMRAFPFTSIIRSLEKTGFEIQSVVDSSLKDYDQTHDHEGRYIIVASKK